LLAALIDEIPAWHGLVVSVFLFSSGLFPALSHCEILALRKILLLISSFPIPAYAEK